MSNSFSALNEEEEEDEEDVKNVYDESANLIQNTKAGGSSSFTLFLLKLPKETIAAESNSSRIRFSMHYQVVLGCSVPWSNERPLENKELNAIIGAWFTLWRD
ncbi:hypothetical protein Tco_0169847 [Tanacetum coccineum]